MNPLTTYYCWNEQQTQVDYIVAEVNNTLGMSAMRMCLHARLEKSRIYPFKKSFKYRHLIHCICATAGFPRHPPSI